MSLLGIAAELAYFCALLKTSVTASVTMCAVSPGAGGRSKPSLLIVDDDEGVVHSFARILRLEGFTVNTAVSAEMGLVQASMWHPDAILVDLRMPLVDGLSFLRRLRASDRLKDTPVAVVTGEYLLDGDVAAELRRLGAQIRYKPLWLDDLVKLAHDLVEVIH
jgi:two-component system response regulator PrrA